MVKARDGWTVIGVREVLFGTPAEPAPDPVVESRVRTSGLTELDLLMGRPVNRWEKVSNRLLPEWGSPS